MRLAPPSLLDAAPLQDTCHLSWLALCVAAGARTAPDEKCVGPYLCASGMTARETLAQHESQGTTCHTSSSDTKAARLWASPAGQMRCHPGMGGRPNDTAAQPSRTAQASISAHHSSFTQDEEWFPKEAGGVSSVNKAARGNIWPRPAPIPNRHGRRQGKTLRGACRHPCHYRAPQRAKSRLSIGRTS